MSSPVMSISIACLRPTLRARATAGVEHLEMPLTPEKVWRALQQR
jgi:hypothetical protein